MAGLLALSLLVIYLIYLGLDQSVYITVGWAIAVLVLLWLGNRFLTKLLSRFFPWLRFGAVSLFIRLFIGILFTLIVINVAYVTFKLLFTTELPTTGQLVIANLYGTVIFIPIFSIYFSLHFLNSWRKSEVETERLRQETVKSELESLKNHLDPHFLFNNLNILSSLIDKDTGLSKTFLNHFAEVYRSLLKSKDEDLIMVSEELDFLDSYIFLLKTRFEDNIRFDLKIVPEVRAMMIPPLTLQMLIENAIKHNIASEKRPLMIEIKSVQDYALEVTNTLYEKPEDLKTRSGSGLDNIKRRYKYFTDKEISLEKTVDIFRVTVPTLQIESV